MGGLERFVCIVSTMYDSTETEGGDERVGGGLIPAILEYRILGRHNVERGLYITCINLENYISASEPATTTFPQNRTSILFTKIPQSPTPYP